MCGYGCLEVSTGMEMGTIKVKFSTCLINHYTMKSYGGAEV
jgi:hypothetical protein